jgi:putative oxygen-independent coproporphyrinogen III oxidase
MEFERIPREFMNNRANHNCATVAEFWGAHAPSRATFGASPNVQRASERFPSLKRFPAKAPESPSRTGIAHEARALPDLRANTPAATEDLIRHLYVHIPFCARICPYCAFYKELLDRSQTQRFCDAIARELEQHQGKATSQSPRRLGSRLSLSQRLFPSTIYFGGGTPTALSTSQLESLLRGFHEQLDLSQLVEWTLEANPGSVSPRKAKVLRKFGVNRISLGVQSWDDELLKLLGREHNARQAEESFHILRAAGFANINVDLMFALPGQPRAQWRETLEKTISLQPEHISTYCLTYEEDTEFFRQHARGEFRSDSDVEAALFEMTMSILPAAGYDHYEISNYARPGFASVHNQAYWSGQDYLGIGPSAFSTVDMQRWQNVCNYREYIERIFDCRSAIASRERLTSIMKHTEKIALSLRTRGGVPADLLDSFPNEVGEFVRLGLLQKSNGNFILTRAGKSLADSVAEAFV